MSEMVERVQKVIADASWSGEQVAWENVARKVIEVMRAPNGQMVKAGIEERERPGSGASVSGIWYAMIDEALK